jgi:hypothetical protein
MSQSNFSRTFNPAAFQDIPEPGRCNSNITHPALLMHTPEGSRGEAAGKHEGVSAGPGFESEPRRAAG